MAAFGTQSFNFGNTLSESHVFANNNPCMRKVTDYTTVIAIDFGSTFSGYAYSKKHAKDDIILNETWGSEMGTQTHKTPTAVLTNDNKEFLKFGYQAKVQYYGTKGRKRPPCHLYDDSFKMRLFYHKSEQDEKKIQLDEITIDSRDGKQSIALFELVTMSLEYLYRHCIERIKLSFKSFDEKQVRVLLTVPAIWDDPAKDFMIKAAKKAGIQSDRLILTLEPEAASLWCQKKGGIPLFNETEYMVLDCGGGTIDIAVHKVHDLKIKQIHRSTGGPWGGNKVNEEFENLLGILLGEKFINDYKKTHPLDWFKIETEFESIKRIEPTDDQEYSINIPTSMEEEYKRQGIRRRNIEKHINKHKDNGYEYNNGRLFISAPRRPARSPGIIESLFSNPIKAIVQAVTSLLKDHSGVKYIFLVGGFSDCHYLWENLTSHIKKMYPAVGCIRPDKEANVAVLKGAVQFGHDPDTITNRISKLTYGAGVMRPFIHGEHDSEKRVSIDGKEMCKDLFHVWARKNESIPVDKERIFTIMPHSKDATKFEVDIYAKDDEHVVYVTEPGVEKLATLEIPIPDNDKDIAMREVKHHVYFGGTQLYVRIQDAARSDGATIEAAIHFEHRPEENLCKPEENPVEVLALPWK